MSDNPKSRTRNEYLAEYRRKNRTRVRAQQQRWKDANRDRVNQSDAAYRENNRERVRDSRRRSYANNRSEVAARARDRKYGFAPGEYDQLLRTQGYVCAICGRPFDNSTRGRMRPVVDHCHTTGKVRGILHDTCNLGIGNFDDNPVFVASAARYLGNLS